MLKNIIGGINGQTNLLSEMSNSFVRKKNANCCVKLLKLGTAVIITIAFLGTLTVWFYQTVMRQKDTD